MEEGGDEALRRDAHLRIADSYYNLHRFMDAAVTYNDVLARNRQASDADQLAYISGDAFIRAEQYRSALTVLGEIITRYPSSDRYDNALYWRGWALFRQEEYNRAIAEYRKVLALQPASDLVPDAWYGIGDAFYNAGDYQAAYDSYMELAHAHADDHWLAEAVGGMQWSLVQLGRDIEAEQIAAVMLETSTPEPVRARVRFQQGMFLFNQERFTDATEVLSSLTYGNPDVAGEALHWLAQSWQRIGDNDRAETSFSQLLDRYPQNSLTEETRIRLGELQYERAGYTEAVRTLEPLMLASTSVRAEALYISALCHRQLNDTTRTEVELRRLIDDYPGSPLATQGRLRLAELAMGRGNYNIAQTQVNTILVERTDELAAEAQYLAGEILFAQQRWSEAEVQYLKVKYVYPVFISWIARALLRAGEANIHLENYEKARTLLQLILDDYPNSSVIQQVRALLDRIPR